MNGRSNKRTNQTIAPAAAADALRRTRSLSLSRIGVEKLCERLFRPTTMNRK